MGIENLVMMMRTVDLTMMTMMNLALTGGGGGGVDDDDGC